MSNIPKDQISQWLKKLERESWQLELLVSAFTIFLLIQAIYAYDDWLTEIRYQYYFNTNLFSMVFAFIGLVGMSLKALTFSLIIHLMLRGFWIGTIGLRSVQSEIDFSQLNYSEKFTDRLKKKVTTLDQLVINLDETCSVIFAFSFLVIAILMSLGLYLLSMGICVFFWQTLADSLPDSFDLAITIGGAISILTILFGGLIYMIDYFTLGFFKKYKWTSKIYYPLYRLFSFITMASLSRSIYYYMISKFSKRKIRWLYAWSFGFFVLWKLFKFDQQPYFPENESDQIIINNYYDNLRPENQFIAKATISSNIVSENYLPLFIRYNPSDNSLIASQCEDFTPIKEDGFNWAFSLLAQKGSVQIVPRDFSKENPEKMIDCVSSIYQISINDSIYNNQKFYFYHHGVKKQNGILTNIEISGLPKGENELRIKIHSGDSLNTFNDFAYIPFWKN